MPLTGIEGPLGKVAARAGAWAAGRVLQSHEASEIRDRSRALVSRRVARCTIDELTAGELSRLVAYLESPDLEEVALQVTLARLLLKPGTEEAHSAAREQLRIGLRTAVMPNAGILLSLTDLIFDALLISVAQVPQSLVEAKRNRDATTAATLAHMAAAGVANSHLLQQLGDLQSLQRFAVDLRAQVTAMHGTMYLPHIGVVRRVPYDDLYVLPPIGGDNGSRWGYDFFLETLASSASRMVILGAPGAGKSTLLGKIAHDIASGKASKLSGRVPFLVTLRNFAPGFMRGESGMVNYLEDVCRDPYNITVPDKGVEYLLRNGRAVVLLDGLDELVDQSLRSRVVRLVEGFAVQYPLVPIVVTARIVGYEAAPLDPMLFKTSEIDQFSEDHIAGYVGRWFTLDDSTPTKSERAQLAKSFLSESADSARELRRSPLILALLCAMYSSEHFIPRNMSQVYERCAIMLFERWDAMRGVAVPMQFRGRIRGAIQYVAWRMLDSRDQSALPGPRIVGYFSQYLESKRLDADEARASAEDFLAFCTGRSWVLTDTGSTESEAKYGFTHRTFMEYFAAEHIVRTNRTAREICHLLEPKLVQGTWDVVAQIVLQLYDRNVEDGGDELLNMLLDSSVHLTGRAAQQLVGFSARALNFVTPSPQTAQRVGSTAVAKYLDPHLDRRYPFVPPDGFSKLVQGFDSALWSAFAVKLPENAREVGSGILSILLESFVNGSVAASDLISKFAPSYIDPRKASFASRWPRPGQNAAGDVVKRLEDAGIRPSEKLSFEILSLGASGDGSLPYRHSVDDGYGLLGPIALRTVNQGTIARLCHNLVKLDTPWLGSDFVEELRRLPSGPWLDFGHRNNSAEIVSILPYLEALSIKRELSDRFRLSTAMEGLLDFRTKGLGAPIDQYFGAEGNSLNERRFVLFLTRWARRELSVIDY